MDVDLAQIFFVGLLMISTTAVQSQITKGPVNALKKVGESITLDCVTRSSNCDGVDWSKMEGAQTPRIVYRDGGLLNGFRDGRYNVSSAGGCTLTITQLKISDSGRFSCKTLTVDASEVTRSSILVVISVTESCRSNVPSSALSQNDIYSFSTAINVPAKSVEPSDVALSFHNVTVGETETNDGSQSQTVTKTLTGKAMKKNIMRVCRASFPPNTVDGFDSSTATLDVCTTQLLTVSYSVDKIAVSPPGPYYKDSRVTCTADGHPSPTFKWTNLKSGTVVDNDTLVIMDEAGYTCTATNTVKGKPNSLSLNITMEVGWPHKPGCGPGCIGGIVGGGVAVIVTTGVISFFVWKRVRATSQTSKILSE